MVSGASLDRGQLIRVRDDVGEETLRHYAAVFLDLIDDRLDRLAHATPGKTADAVWAALDLRSSSAMLGARRLAALASRVGSALRAGVPVDPGRMRMLRAEAEEVAAALPRELNRLDDPGAGSADYSPPDDPASLPPNR